MKHPLHGELYALFTQLLGQPEVTDYVGRILDQLDEIHRENRREIVFMRANEALLQERTKKLDTIIDAVQVYKFGKQTDEATRALGDAVAGFVTAGKRSEIGGGKPVTPPDDFWAECLTPVMSDRILDGERVFPSMRVGDVFDVHALIKLHPHLNPCGGDICFKWSDGHSNVFRRVESREDLAGRMFVPRFDFEVKR